jgi:hypothetical protein
LFLAAFLLHPARAGRHDQRLSQRMRMPVCPCARGKRDVPDSLV